MTLRRKLISSAIHFVSTKPGLWLTSVRSEVCGLGSTPLDNALLLHAVKKMLDIKLKLQSEGGVYRPQTDRLTLLWWPEEGLLVLHPSSIAMFTPAERNRTEGYKEFKSVRPFSHVSARQIPSPDQNSKCREAERNETRHVYVGCSWRWLLLSTSFACFTLGKRDSLRLKRGCSCRITC